MELEAVLRVRELLAEVDLRRDELIEYLHLIQDEYGCLSAANLAALAEVMKLSMTEVYEVASFYAHFDIVKEGEDAPPPHTIRVCDSIACQLAGAEKLLADLRAAKPKDTRILRAPCMGRCDSAPVAEVGHFHACHATCENILRALDDGKKHPVIPDYTDFAAYQNAGGYALLRACINERT